MTRALWLSPMALLVACGGDDTADDTPTAETGDLVQECVDNDGVNAGLAAGEPSGAVDGALGLLVSVAAQFRYDASTDAAGSLDVLGEDNELQGIVVTLSPASDPIDPMAPGCTIIIPMTAENTAPATVAGSDVWGVEVSALLPDLVSNCDDPAYETIQQYAGGDPTVIFANDMVLTLAAPSEDAVAFVTSTQGLSAQNFVIGGSLSLRPDFDPFDLAVTARSADECGVLDPDDNERILASDVLANGPTEGIYFVDGVTFLTLTVTPG